MTKAGPARVRRVNLDGHVRRAYCETMKNITVSVDDEIYRRARVRAAERETSLSALVRQFLTELAAEESSTARLAREERELRARIDVFTARDRMSRDDLHQRGE